MGRLIPILAVVILCSCKAYKQDIMFQFDEEFTENDITSLKDGIDKNYTLKPNDRFQLDVFTNKGERLIDPNFEISSLVGGQAGQQIQQQRDIFQYTIQGDSTVTFPLVGDMNLVGMTLYEAEIIVAEEFENFYEDSFVKLRINNRRAFVLGAMGGQVIPLENENMGIIEVIALAEGLDPIAKANNIKVIRGQDIFKVDLSTISGMRKSNIIIQPEDVIYIEPWRRPWFESLRDATPLLSIITSAVTLAFVIRTL